MPQKIKPIKRPPFSSLTSVGSNIPVNPQSAIRNPQSEVGSRKSVDQRSVRDQRDSRSEYVLSQTRTPAASTGYGEASRRNAKTNRRLPTAGPDSSFSPLGQCNENEEGGTDLAQPQSA